MVVFGVVNSKKEHIDVSMSLHGAKCYATRNDYKNISERHGYTVVKEWERINDKWVELY